MILLLALTAFASDFDVDGRVIGGWGWAVRHPENGQGGFEGVRHSAFLDQARIGVEWRPKAPLEAQISLEFGDLIEARELNRDDQLPVLRDARIDLKVSKTVEVRLGRFKRPFSGIALDSRNDLPFSLRGLFNAEVTRDLGWGSRALGAMGRFKFRDDTVRFEAAVMSGDVDQPGFDGLGRLEVQTGPVRLAANGGVKRITNVDDYVVLVGAAGVDAHLDVGGLHVYAELDLAQDWTDAPNLPLFGGLVVYGTYDLPVSEQTALQPVLVGEWVDSDVGYVGGSALRGSLGFNVLWTRHVRFMTAFNLVRPLGDVTSDIPWVRSEGFELLVAARL